MTASLDGINASLLGAYEIERELGQGGMATVYLARDQKHGRDVAIKVLKPDVGASVGRERFLREIQLAARLTHPHILALHDSGEAGGALYYVMPRVQGRSLRERLDAGPIPIDEAVRIAQDVASALDYAHRHDTVHRDIKPENIMLQDGHALVTDFGIGKAVSDVANDTLTQTGMSVGTPAYMSPEQAVGESVDGRSDIYSLGCVLYEMLAGEPPFTGPNMQAVIAKRFVQVPADVAALRDGVPRPIARAVQKSLARAPIDRYQTAAELLADLRERETHPAPGAGKANAAALGPSIAVLPFENLSADKDNDYFGDGIAEEIINALAQVKGLHVAARTSAFSFKGKPDDLRLIGEKLSVATVLEGSVRKAGARLRITAQLIDVADGYHMWSERYDRELVDVFAVQDEIAAAIAAKLAVTFEKANEPRAPATTLEVELHDAFMKGRALVASRHVLTAIPVFERVIELDSSHARAHACLADALRLATQFGLIAPDSALPRVKAEIARALELDPALGEVRGTAAVIEFSLGRNPRGAIAEWERALELDPRLSEARAMYAEYGLLFARNDRDRAADEARRAARDDPRSSIVASLASQTLSMCGHFEEGKELALRAVEIDDTGITALSSAALACSLCGDTEAALSYAAQGINRSIRAPLSVAICAAVSRGQRDRARAYHAELIARAALEPVPWFALALTADAAGLADEAMDYAMRSAEVHEVLAGSLVRSPLYATVLAHPRFAELDRRITLRA